MRTLLPIAVVLVLQAVAAADILPTGAEFQVNTYTTADQIGGSYNVVCRAPGGAFVIVWDDARNGGDVFGQRYDSAGARLGTEFRANTYTTGNQGDAAVACDAAGSFVILWDSYLQDGDFSGVYARRFTSAGAPADTEFR
jgi:hypothetical protein